MNKLPLLSKEKHILYLSASVFLGLLSILIVFVIIWGFLSLSYFNKATNKDNVISVVGNAEIFAVPGIANITFSIQVEKETVDLAQEEATKRTNATLSFLEKQKIKDKDIKTTNYSVYPRYEYVQKKIVCITYPCPRPPRERVLKGYSVNQSISIKVRNISNIGTILAGIGKQKVTNISGPYFEVDNKEELKLKARKDAIKNARVQAKELASSLGVKLGDIVSFNEGNMRNIGIYKESFAIANNSTSAIPSSIPEIPIGENVIRSTVTVVYEIK